tara:strand:- start:310 stop:1140 length:831 start_codon:yes stop_codon:yes gene_type:complete
MYYSSFKRSYNKKLSVDKCFKQDTRQLVLGMCWYSAWTSAIFTDKKSITNLTIDGSNIKATFYRPKIFGKAFTSQFELMNFQYNNWQNIVFEEISFNIDTKVLCMFGIYPSWGASKNSKEMWYEMYIKAFNIFFNRFCFNNSTPCGEIYKETLADSLAVDGGYPYIAPLLMLGDKCKDIKFIYTDDDDFKTELKKTNTIIDNIKYNTVLVTDSKTKLVKSHVYAITGRDQDNYIVYNPWGRKDCRVDKINDGQSVVSADFIKKNFEYLVIVGRYQK